MLAALLALLTALLHLSEKDTHEKLELLYKRNLYQVGCFTFFFFLLLLAALLPDVLAAALLAALILLLLSWSCCTRATFFFTFFSFFFQMAVSLAQGAQLDDSYIVDIQRKFGDHLYLKVCVCV